VFEQRSTLSHTPSPSLSDVTSVPLPSPGFVLPAHEQAVQGSTPAKTQEPSCLVADAS
jgi:hypothetical protein